MSFLYWKLSTSSQFFLSVPVVAVAGMLSLSTVAPAHAASMGFGSGTTNKAAGDCARDAMAALPATGFDQNLTFLNANAPAFAAFGNRREGPMAMVICGVRGDIAVVVTSSDPSTDGKAESYKQALVQKLNEIMTSH